MKNRRKKPCGELVKISPADFMMNDLFIFKSESFVKFERKSLIRKESDV